MRRLRVRTGQTIWMRLRGRRQRVTVTTTHVRRWNAAARRRREEER